MSSLWHRVDESLAERDASGLRRTLTARSAESTLIDLSNNDYMRLSQHPEVIAAGQAAMAKWGASAAASPLISGYTEAHAELEARLCQWAGFSSCLVWNSGYAANQAVLGRLPQRGDLVLADRLIHASMIEGVLHSGARLQRYQHLDLGHLESLLEQHTGDERDVFVLTESVFSMDGDYPDLAAMAELKARYGFIWIVDEAHAIGWYGAKGSGLVEEAGVAEFVDVLVGTLGKGLGSMGAFTLFRKVELREYLINFANEFIYSTYLAPASAAAASKAVEIAEAMTEERVQWRQRSRDFRSAIAEAPDGDSPIVPVLLGPADKTMAAAQELLMSGFRVGAVRPPTVPANSSRLRISLNTGLTEGQLEQLTAVLQEVAR
ncbi:aminotransferase class I/II-fold pyridoxal phosphate-dependent enzyme [Cerasicoccus fimbriatus]|uniref:aminotransferase class I/II-fold pyridoxal phosphate-dependent enzyme n=1 Tax=Cerasicoccus fimbriatus TaxID=3014554 RepID=UPI0022B56147|nr:8-amino-7-oxononanoate synthase [Cerasicoccus sp. TK19100]